MSLDAVIDTLRAGDERLALKLAIDEWRQHRLPRLATIIEWLSARLGPVEPVRDQGAWCELAKARDPFVLPGLLATLTEPKFREAEDRASALRGWEDPRITTAFIGILSAPRFKAPGAQYFYRRFYEALVAVGDPRAPPQLRALADRYHEVVTNTYGAAMARDMRGAAERMELNAAPEDAATKARLDELERFFEHERADAVRAAHGKAEMAAREAALRAQVAERPDDDGLRQVWADVLVEMGDPRGELINFQLMERQGGLSAQQLEQLRALQARHRDRLLGAIAPKVVNAVFDRGVAVHVELGRDWGTPTTSEPEWQQVRGVTLPAERWRSQEWVNVLAALPRLETVMRVDHELINLLYARRPGLQLANVLYEFPEEFSQVPPARHVLVRDPTVAVLLRKVEAERVTLEVSDVRDIKPTVELMKSAVARRVRWVDAVHLLDPDGFYGWSFELDQVERRLDIRGRFPKEPDLARLEAWRQALAPLNAGTHLHTEPERDALYLPLSPLPRTTGSGWLEPQS